MLKNPIGTTILRILDQDDVSQATFALRADVNDTTVSRWVHGARPRDDQWPKILTGLRRSRFEFEVELARVQCDYCIRQAHQLGEQEPVFARSPLVRKLETVLTLDFDRVDEKHRSPMVRIRDLIVTIVSQSEPLLREFEELYAGTVSSDSLAPSAPHPLAPSPAHPSRPPGRGGTGNRGD